MKSFGPSRQHILPKTYLKHFSKNGDGKNLCILHRNHPYKKNIEVKDSGSSLFVRNNFYDSGAFSNPKEIELFFAKKLEPNYNKIIAAISEEKEITDYLLKIRLLEWVIYSVIRSVSWREMFRIELQDDGYIFDFDSDNLREEHLQILTDTKTYDWVLDYYDKELSSKRWVILKSPVDSFWLTSDNPGFTVNVEGYADKIFDVYPNPYCTNLQHDTMLYFPLTKEYCLKVHPYYEGDDVKLNLSNTSIGIDVASEFEFQLINSWTYLTQHSFIIGCSREGLKMFEEINRGNNQAENKDVNIKS